MSATGAETSARAGPGIGSTATMTLVGAMRAEILFGVGLGVRRCARDAPDGASRLQRPPESAQAHARSPQGVLATDRLILTLALGGLALLGLVIHATAPREAALADLGRLEGARVEVEGVVVSAHAFPRGAVLSLVGDETRADVWLDELPDSVGRGDLVRVAGLAASGPDGAPSVSARATDVLVVRSAREPLSVADLARSAPTRVGLPSVTRGEVARGALGWLVHDGAGSSIALGSMRDPSPGAATLEGRVRYDDERALYVLEVARWTRA